MRAWLSKWLILIITVAWLGWELPAASDHNPHTWPLTEVIVTYVPPWLYLPAALVLGIWVPYHFWSNWRASVRRASKEAVMTNPLPTPLPTKRDAINRAVRTFVAGLWLDVATAVVAALVLGLSDVHWTKAWWVALGILLAKTAGTAVVSYVRRYLSPPPSA
jgi:hypothetical protein